MPCKEKAISKNHETIEVTARQEASKMPRKRDVTTLQRVKPAFGKRDLVNSTTRSEVQAFVHCPSPYIAKPAATRDTSGLSISTRSDMRQTGRGPTFGD